ncbi:alpha-galactosidase [Trifolium repens]|nr:alpha-galactosidase [Trifolium repens]
MVACNSTWCQWDINTVDHAEDEFMVIACDGIWLIFFQVLGFCLLSLWNSWNHFQCNITEDLIKETAGTIY